MHTHSFIACDRDEAEWDRWTRRSELWKMPPAPYQSLQVCPNVLTHVWFLWFAPFKASACHMAVSGLQGYSLNETHRTKGRKAVTRDGSVKNVQPVALCLQSASNAVGCLREGWFHWNHFKLRLHTVIPSVVCYDVRSGGFRQHPLHS